MQTLTALNREQGVTIIVVTHEPDIAAYADRMLTMRDGQIISDERKRKSVAALRTIGRTGDRRRIAQAGAIHRPIGRHLGVRIDGHGGSFTGHQPQ